METKWFDIFCFFGFIIIETIIGICTYASFVYGVIWLGVIFIVIDLFVLLLGIPLTIPLIEDLVDWIKYTVEDRKVKKQYYEYLRSKEDK